MTRRSERGLNATRRDVGRTAVLVAALLVAGCPAIGPEPQVTTADGPAFEQTRWAMTREQVSRLYPAARARGDDLLLEKPFGDLSARIHFRFVRGALSVVELDLSGDRAIPGAVCDGKFEAAWRELAARHGTPERGDSRLATWAPPGAEVVLACLPSDESPTGALSITYRASDRRPSIPRFDPIPSPRPGHEYE